MRQNIYN